MRHHAISRKDIYGLCADLSADDGVGPHAGLRQASMVRQPHGQSRAGLDRKAIQLCHQVAETLEEVLAECGDRFSRTCGWWMSSQRPTPRGCS